MLQSESIADKKNAPVIVLFGGNPFRRDEIIKLIKSIAVDITVYGTLSEIDGFETIKSLPKIDLILIGGMYSESQRNRIKKFILENLKETKITEPGWNYEYENEAIKKDIKQKLNIY
jgi:hypothetical protein